MSDWKIVVPTATTNMVLNPSAETTGNYAAEAGTAVTRVTTRKYGFYSYFVETDADNEGIELTLSALTNAAHYVSMRVSGTLPTSWDWSLDDATYTSPTLIEAIDDNWDLYGLAFNATQSNGSTKLSIHQNGAGAGNFYLDGIQVELGTTWTTYCDGDQIGCSWNLGEHSSTSSRSAYSRAGGTVYDLTDDYSFDITGYLGTGASTIETSIDSYATLPGGILNEVKTQPRNFTILGAFRGTSMSNLHSLRQALEEELAHDKYPRTEDGWQPVRLRYTGATVQKEINCHYQGGLEGQVTTDGVIFWERLPLRFIAGDPNWYGIGDSGSIGYIWAEDSTTLRYITARIVEFEQWTDAWSALGVDAGGSVYCILPASDGYIYVGGNFTNWDNNADADYIVRYNPQAEVWDAITSDGDFNGIVHCLAEGPDGTIYAGGIFTAVEGAGDQDYVVQFDGTDWENVGDPDSGAASITGVYCMAFDSDGNLYVGGMFENFADVAAADGLAKWNGSAWSAVGAPAVTGATQISAIAIDSQDNIYVGGNFANLAGDAEADSLAWWNGTAWSDVGGVTPNGAVEALAVDQFDNVYIGGLFTDLAGIFEADYIAVWNGASYAAMGTGTNGTVYKIRVAPDGTIYIAGLFTMAGNSIVTDSVAQWSGSEWIHLDINLPGTVTVREVNFRTKALLEAQYEIWLGFNTTGTAYYSYIYGITYDGTATQYPIFKIYHSVTTTPAPVLSIRNETTGKRLALNYDLLPGEILTIDCRPAKKSIRSSFFGERPKAMMPDSDFGSFGLVPGVNYISVFENDNTGTPLYSMEWRTAYLGAD